MSDPAAFDALAVGKTTDDGVNQQWRAARRPDGHVTPADFAFTETPIPDLAPGEALLRVHYLGLAPVMRMYMTGAAPSGETLTACLDRLRMHARIVLCGSISEYLRNPPFALPNYTGLRATDSRMSGLFGYNHLHRWNDVMAELAGWIHDERLKPVQDVIHGFSHMPRALAQLYDGRNVGVQCCSVRGAPEVWS